jgi:hypothetical protein
MRWTLNMQNAKIATTITTECGTAPLDICLHHLGMNIKHAGSTNHFRVLGSRQGDAQRHAFGKHGIPSYSGAWVIGRAARRAWSVQLVWQYGMSKVDLAS